MNQYRAFIGLGSNVGERFSFLRHAAEAIRRIEGVRVVAYSSVYETDPFGNTAQGGFLNAAAEIETTLAPAALLKALKRIETEVGRTKSERWGPREIDLDILLYDGVVQNEAEVTVPHPGLAERRFVLVPLRELAPDVVHPVTGYSIEELASACRDKGKVVKTSYHLHP